MTKKLYKHLLYATSALGLSVAGPALAQTAPAPAETVLPDVVVTARRVEERLQDVPIAITVYNQQQLTNRNVVSAADLATTTPSLTANTRFGSENASFAIRGFSQELRTTASVAIYFADVVALRGAGTTTQGDGAGPGSFFDLQNVQVLKGPQGTLFGRNTTAGAVLLVPQKPTDRYEGHVEGSLGNYNMKRIQAVFNAPLADWARVRVGIDRQKRDGYLKNISGVGPERFSDLDYTAGRASLVLDLTPNLENYTIGSITHSDTNGGAAAVDLCFPERFPVGTLACGLVSQLSNSGFYSVFGNIPDPTTTMKQWQVINTTTWQAASNLTVKNIVSYGELKNVNRNEVFGANFTIPSRLGPIPSTGAFAGLILPFTSVQAAPGLPTANQSTFTEELQVQGRSFGDRLTWQGGVYFEHSRPLSQNGTLQPGLLYCTDIPGFQCTDVLGTLLGRQGRLGNLNNQVGATSYNDWAVYAQGTYSLTDKLNLTAGIRYTQDETKSTVQKVAWRFFTPNVPTGICISPLVRTIGLPINTIYDCTEHFEEKSDAPTWLLNLDYKPTDDVMLYAKYSRGYRMGSTNPFGADGYTTFGPEKVDAFEVGAKTTFSGPMPGRLNAALFWNNLRDQQLQIGFLSSTGVVTGSTGILNAGKSRIYGLELEGSVSPFEGFTLDGAYTYVESDIKKVAPVVFIPGSLYDVAIAVPEGARMPMSPKHKATLTAEYRLPVSENIGRITASATYAFTSSQLTSYTPKFGILKSFQVLNLNLNWNGIGGGPVDASLFATNVTQEEYNSWINEFTSTGFVGHIRGEPRMFGVRVRYHFGE